MLTVSTVLVAMRSSMVRSLSLLIVWLLVFFSCFFNYTKLENVGTEDYFCRFKYKAATDGFTLDRVTVYCKCELPYNPDDLMVQCEECKDCHSILGPYKRCSHAIVRASGRRC